MLHATDCNAMQTESCHLVEAFHSIHVQYALGYLSICSRSDSAASSGQALDPKNNRRRSGRGGGGRASWGGLFRYAQFATCTAQIGHLAETDGPKTLDTLPAQTTYLK